MVQTLVRLEILRRLIKTGTEVLPWCGNLAIQKLVYLIQHVFHVDLGYSYGLHHLGPYSRDLASELSLGEQHRYWTRWEMEYSSPSGRGKGKRFDVADEPPVNGNILRQSEDKWDLIRSSLDKVLDQLRELRGRDLELVATIDYLRAVQGVEEKNLWDVLSRLKPKFTEEEFATGKARLLSFQEASSVSTPGGMIASGAV